MAKTAECADAPNVTAQNGAASVALNDDSSVSYPVVRGPSRWSGEGLKSWIKGQADRSYEARRKRRQDKADDIAWVMAALSLGGTPRLHSGMVRSID